MALPFFIRPALGLLATLLLFSGSLPETAAAPSPSSPRAESTLPSIAATLAKQAEDPLKRYTVKIRGVVTHRSNGLTDDDSFYIQDQSAGIKVDVTLAQKRYIWRDPSNTLSYLEEGSEVEIEGVIEPTPLLPSILPSSIQILPKTPLPPALSRATESVMQGENLLKRVQLTGVVHSVTKSPGSRLKLRVDTGIGAYFIAQVPDIEDFQAPILDNATITFTGVAVPILNAQNRFIRPLILVSNERNIEVIKRPPIDPFSVPKRDLADFAGFSPKARDLHRTLTRGTVTYWEPGSLLYIQDKNVSLRIVTDSFESLKIGDVVEASGYMESIGVVGELRRALIRKVESGTAPLPINADFSKEDPTLTGGNITPSESLRLRDGLLVQVTGHLLRTNLKTHPDRLELTLDTGQSLTTAILRHETQSGDFRTLEELRLGSLVSVTGVATVEYNFPEPGEDYPRPARLDLLLRDAKDVTLLELASWWTTKRITYAFGLIGALLLISLIWTLVLRHMVLQRCKQLEAAMRLHRDSELEFKAAQQERQRLASDLHDGIQQLIVGAAFRLEAATAQLGEISLPAQEQFAATRTALLSAQTSLRNFLAGSSSIEESTSDFAALITHTFQSVVQWPRNAVTVQTLGEPFALSRHVMGSLLLLMQEAISNAFKHGSATEVETRLIYKDETLEIRVEDNGTGFDPQNVPGKGEGHFGLDSMRHRMRWLGGAVDIQSTPKKGTCVRIRLPRSKSKATRRLRSV